jgi:hypothetical protein
MTHIFDIEHAKVYGIEEAIIIANLQFWITKNRANGKHEHDGRTWTYNTIKAMSELFPYMSANTIRRALEKLVEKGVLLTGNYNSSTYDRTLWYAFSDESTWLNCQKDLAKVPNGNGKSAKPIPDRKPVSKPDTNTSDPLSGPPAKVPPGQRSLEKSICEAMYSQTKFSDWAVEMKVAKKIAKGIQSLSPDDPWGATGKILARYHELITGRDRFWQGQPFTPRGLSPHLDRVWALVTKDEADDDWVDQL